MDSEILSAKLDSLQTLVSDFSSRVQLPLDKLGVLTDYRLLESQEQFSGPPERDYQDLGLHVDLKAPAAYCLVL